MKKYVLYGVGLEAEKFLYNNFSMKNQIEYCIDLFHKGEFHGIPIVTIENAENLDKYKVLVAAIWETYLRIKDILEKKGLKEFSNFIWATEFNKKIVGINANCHGLYIKEYLENCYEFTRKYVIHPIPQIHMNDNKEIPIEVLKNLDVFIHQDIQEENKYGYRLSDEYTTRYLKIECKNIVMPNFVGMAGYLFPQIEGNGRRLKMPHGEKEIFFPDIVMEEAYEKELSSIEEYIEFYNKYSFSPVILQEKYDKNIHKMKEREKNWSFEIVDWIIDNFRYIPCFVDSGHPSSYLMYEVSRRLGLLLGIEEEPDINILKTRLGTPTPILQCVKDFYSVEYKVNCDKPLDFFGGFKDVNDLAGYIRGYLWWYHGVVL